MGNQDTKQPHLFACDEQMNNEIFEAWKCTGNDATHTKSIVGGVLHLLELSDRLPIPLCFQKVAMVKNPDIKL